LPIHHQFEQLFNAKCIERMGVGVFHKTFNEEDFRQFLLNLAFYRKNLERYDPGDPEEILARIQKELENVVTQKR
jgi:hypothetical protein